MSGKAASWGIIPTPQQAEPEPPLRLALPGDPRSLRGGVRPVPQFPHRERGPQGVVPPKAWGTQGLMTWSILSALLHEQTPLLSAALRRGGQGAPCYAPAGAKPPTPCLPSRALSWAGGQAAARAGLSELPQVPCRPDGPLGQLPQHPQTPQLPLEEAEVGGGGGGQLPPHWGARGSPAAAAPQDGR